MNLTCHRFISTGLMLSGVFGAAQLALAKPVASDLSTPEKRRTFVETASRVAKPGKAAALPSDLALPFNPPGFDQTDAQERAATATAAQGPVVQRVVNDRDTLEQIAAKIVPTGSMRDKSGEPLLTFGQKTVKKGAHITVTLPNGQQHDLELINIDSTTFTLRLNREEITRLIKPAKSP